MPVRGLVSESDPKERAVTDSWAGLHDDVPDRPSAKRAPVAGATHRHLIIYITLWCYLATVALSLIKTVTLYSKRWVVRQKFIVTQSGTSVCLG